MLIFGHKLFRAITLSNATKHLTNHLLMTRHGFRISSRLITCTSLTLTSKSDQAEDDEQSKVNYDKKEQIKDSEQSIVIDDKKAASGTIIKPVVKVVPKLSRKPKLDVTQATTERNFITPVRAMNDYLLKPSDLTDLRKFERRSPYVDAPAITVYLRRDVEAKAMQVWRTLDNLQRELKKKKAQQESYRDSVLNVKKILKEYARQNDPEAKMKEEILKSSGRVVMYAVVINFANFMFKGLAWLYTGSYSLFAESVHSLADTCNQLILYFGIRKSIQLPNEEHPYGYHNARYIASLISGVGIFCVGSGLSIYHGIHGLLHPATVESLYWGYLILGGSLLSEGGTLMIAYNSIRKGAQRANMSVKEFIFRSSDPSVNVVFMEDLAAVLGVGIAACCMGLTSYYNNPVYDSVGSLLVGGLLGVVASFVIYTNSGALVGRSIPTRQIESINKCLEDDVMVRAIYDVKATDLGNDMVRYKAEVDIDGTQLTRRYLDGIDLEALLHEMQNLKNIEDVEALVLKHGENIVDLLGAEVDRIEKEMKKKHPQLRHVDLEVL